MKFITTRNGIRDERDLRSEEERYATLQQQFGISPPKAPTHPADLPKDTSQRKA
jgi:hypothetical protein